MPAPKKVTAAEKYFADLHADGKLTRVPVAHLYFADTIDHSGNTGDSQMSNRACYRPGGVRPPSDANRYYVCDFIPAWQCFEFSFVPGPEAPPITELLPAVHVRRWKRAL